MPPRAARRPAEPPEPVDTVDELDALLQEASQSTDAKIVFFRYDGPAGTWQYLEQLGVPDVQAIGIREVTKQRHGGGRFRARIRTAGKFGRSQNYEIAGDPRSGPVTAAAANGPSTSTGSSDELLELMKKKMLERMFDAPKPAFGITEVTALLAALSPIVIAFMKRDDGGKDPMEIATKIAELVAQRNGPRTEIKDVIGAVTEMMELRDRLAPSGGSDPMADALRVVAPVIADAFASSRNNPRPPATDTARPVRVIEQTIPPAVTAGSAPDAQPVTTSTETSEPAWANELRPHISQLVRVASSGRDPRGLANSLHDFFLPDRHKGVLRELVAQADAEAQLLAAFPELAPYTTWLAEFVDELRIIFGFVEPPDEGDQVTT